MLICIIIVAVFFLMGQNSKEKREYEAAIKQQSQEMTDSLISELEQIDTSELGQSPMDGTVSSTEVPDEIITDAEKQLIGEELAKLEDERKRQILQTLSVAYSKALNEQKQEAFSMVDDLVAQAKADWSAIGGEGDDSSVKRGSLITGYLAKSRVMENQMDANFDALVSKMKEQLEAEGIDSTAIIEEYKAEYEKIKAENRSALMDKAWAAIKE